MVVKYKKLIYKVIHRLEKVYPNVPFEDLEQDAYIIMFQLHKKYDRTKSKFSTYLYNSLYWNLIEKLKGKYSLIATPKYAKQIYTQKKINDLLNPTTIEFLKDIPDKSIKEDYFVLDAYLEDKLPFIYYRLVNLIYLKGYTQKDVSLLLGLSERTINRQLSSIKQILKNDTEFYDLLKGV